MVAYEFRQPSPNSPLALRTDDAAVRRHGGRGERHRRAGRALLCRLPGMAVIGESRTDRRLPDAPPLCHRSVHHVLPYGGAWHDKQCPLARRAGYGETARNADFGHEQVPGAERQAGIRGDGAQSRNRLPRVNEEFDKQLEELGWSPSDMVTMAGMYIERGMYNMKKGIRDFFREILELMFQAAALVIDTIRTFFLVVLAILGPIAFAISVWDGFQSTLTQWICRYIQVYLWLPVSDIFSTILAKIQVLMLQSDIERMQTDPNFSLDSSDGVYIVFMIIGIIGYFTIPTVAGWIIQAGGMGSYGRNVNQTAGRAGSMAGSVAGATAGNVVGRAGKLLK